MKPCLLPRGPNTNSLERTTRGTPRNALHGTGENILSATGSIEQIIKAITPATESTVIPAFAHEETNLAAHCKHQQDLTRHPGMPGSPDRRNGKHFPGSAGTGRGTDAERGPRPARAAASPHKAWCEPARALLAGTACSGKVI